MDNRTQAVIIVFAGSGDGSNLGDVVDRHDATQSVSRKLFDERLGEPIQIFDEPFLELIGPIIGATIGSGSAGLHQRISAKPASHFFCRPPPSDRVVVLEGEAQWVDLLVAGSTNRMRRVGL